MGIQNDEHFAWLASELLDKFIWRASDISQPIESNSAVLLKSCWHLFGKTHSLWHYYLIWKTYQSNLNIRCNCLNPFQNLLGQLRTYSAKYKYGRIVFEVKSTGYLHSLCQYVTVGRSCTDKLNCAPDRLQTGCKFDIWMRLMKTKEQCNRQCQRTLWSKADRHSDEWYPGELAVLARNTNKSFRFSEAMSALHHEITCEGTAEVLGRVEEPWPYLLWGTLGNIYHAYACNK